MKYKELTFSEFINGKTQTEAAEQLGITQRAIRKKIALAEQGADERVYTRGGRPIWRAIIKTYPIEEGYEQPRIKQ